MEQIKKGTIVKVKHIIGDTVFTVANIIEKPGVENNHFTVLQFFKDAYLVGETTKGGYFHLRQAREVRDLPFSEERYLIDRSLRAACTRENIKSYCIPGGGFPLFYIDEIAIADFGMTGTSFFIVKKEALDILVDVLL